jgi:hypothetical protein
MTLLNTRFSPSIFIALFFVLLITITTAVKSPDKCSSARSREARELLEAVQTTPSLETSSKLQRTNQDALFNSLCSYFSKTFYPKVDSTEYKLPKSCVFHPSNDLMAIFHNQEQRAKLSRWRCKLCDKNFRTLEMIDSHLIQEHSAKLLEDVSFPLQILRASFWRNRINTFVL